MRFTRSWNCTDNWKLILEVHPILADVLKTSKLITTIQESSWMKIQPHLECYNILGPVDIGDILKWNGSV